MAGTDSGMQAVSMVSTAVVHLLILGGMAMAGMGEKEEENPEPPPMFDIIDLELPKLGEERPPEALPRLVQPPPPPPPETDTASLSREIEEAEEKKQAEEKKKRELAEKAKRDEEKRQELEAKKLKRKEDRDRRKRMKAALDKLPDDRADEDSPDGFKDGSAGGTSTDAVTLRAKQMYQAQLALVLSRQVKVPGLRKDQIRRLKATVFIKIDARGKLKGQPKLLKPSGNRMFDDAALAAMRKFGPGSALKVPLPKDADYRREILRMGIKPTIDGSRIAR
jgi:TonB family protein